MVLGKITKSAAESATIVSIRDVLLPELLSGDKRVKAIERVVEGVL